MLPCRLEAKYYERNCLNHKFHYKDFYLFVVLYHTCAQRLYWHYGGQRYGRKKQSAKAQREQRLLKDILYSVKILSNSLRDCSTKKGFFFSLKENIMFLCKMKKLHSIPNPNDTCQAIISWILQLYILQQDVVFILVNLDFVS